MAAAARANGCAELSDARHVTRLAHPRPRIGLDRCAAMSCMDFNMCRGMLKGEQLVVEMGERLG